MLTVWFFFFFFTTIWHIMSICWTGLFCFILANLISWCWERSLPISDRWVPHIISLASWFFFFETFSICTNLQAATLVWQRKYYFENVFFALLLVILRSKISPFTILNAISIVLLKHLIETGACGFHREAVIVDFQLKETWK